MKHLSLSCMLLLFLSLACENPFNTDIDDGDDPLLVITAETTRLPIYDTAFVDLSWPQLAVDDFVRFQITRIYINDQNSIPITSIFRDPRTTAFRDTLYDDESVHYQLDVFTINGFAGSSEINVLIPYTTRVQIPAGGNDFEDFARSIVADAGDTLQLEPGTHLVSALDLVHKRLFIEGLGSAKDVVLKWYPIPPSADLPFFLIVRDATIKNLTMVEGVAEHGGAIVARGNTKIRNCIFVNNIAQHDLGSEVGAGDALLLLDDVEVSNCIIYSDTLNQYGSAILIDQLASGVKILNTTIFGNIAYIVGSAINSQLNTSSFIVKNCIFAQDSANTVLPGTERLTGFDITYNIMDASWSEFNSTNISQTPLFVDPENGDFHLVPGSPGIDMGDPDPAYDDTDGTQNDMGAYGGPYGDW